MVASILQGVFLPVSELLKADSTYNSDQAGLGS